MIGLRQGVLAIVPAVFAMALTDAIIKQWSGGISLWQIWVLRSLLVLPVLFVMARGRVRSAEAGWIALRSLALIMMYLCMYPALPLIDMALAGAAFYTAPLFIVGLSAMVLGHRVTVWQWLAILTGFLGLLLVVRPFGATFTPVIVMPVAAAACYACSAIVTRARCLATGPVVLAFWVNVGCLGVSGIAILLLQAGLPVPQDFPLLFGTWQPMDLRGWGTIALLALLMLGAAIGVAMAYQSPYPAVIATLEYSYMIFVIFWGYVFFNEVPDAWTLAGMVLIVAGGVAVLLAPADASKADKRPARDAGNPGPLVTPRYRQR